MNRRRQREAERTELAQQLELLDLSYDPHHWISMERIR